MSIDKKYSHKELEKKWYDFWVKNELFEPRGNGPKFSVAVPPPNVTGILHIGHCLNTSIQDVIVRYKRMKGFATLWLPGLDHAGISTQQKVMEKLSKEGKTSVTKEEFTSEAWQWKEKYGNTILDQFKKLGLSLAWSRERFTLDEKYKEAVKEFFIRLYKDRLIYRGEYLINWSTEYMTALSDDEVEFKNLRRKLWTIAYKLVDGGEILIATTRPETMLGDSAIAVNPDDERYKGLIGKKAIVPLVNREIPIIADDYVKPDFGTGALKVTPAHDPSDFEMGKRHNLEIINIFDKDLKINILYKGLNVEEARRVILKDLEKLSLVRSVSEIESPVAYCSKSGKPIESVISTQWFVKMKPLAERAIEVVKSGEIEIRPDHWKKTYFHWLENIKDWCISRQLWWGHNIPVSYEGNKILLDESGSVKEEDVLDTWFSSALWPFATLEWPETTEDLKRFYPTDMVVTGGDIIFFWVARMIMASLYCLDKIPFNKVLFHGIVRDEKGRKMSKSLGNSPDPLDIIEKYGADALRFALIYNSSMGNDLFYSESWLEIGRNFCNKLWNTYRFIEMNRQDSSAALELDIIDEWVLGELSETIQKVEDNIESMNLDVALKSIYNFFWGEFADWYVELAKIDIKEGKIKKVNVLSYVFNQTLKLLHPFIPFLTEELFQLLRYEDALSISISEFPELKREKISIEAFKDIVKFVRNTRKEFNIPSSAELQLSYKKIKESELPEEMLQKFINVKIVKRIEDSSLLRTTENVEMTVSLKSIDVKSEIKKLKAKLEIEQEELEKVERKLNNKDFLEKAPLTVIEKEKRILEEYQEKVRAIKERLDLLEKSCF